MVRGSKAKSDTTFRAVHRTCRCLNGSHDVEETAYVPFERAYKIKIWHVEFVSFDELAPEISWIKGLLESKLEDPP